MTKLWPSGKSLSRWSAAVGLLCGVAAGADQLNPNADLQRTIAQPPPSASSANDLATACKDKADQFEVCRMVADLQRMGNETFNNVKEYLNMGPYEVALFSAMNAGVTQRVQFRTDFIKLPNTFEVIDIQREQIRLILEKRF